MRVLIELGCSDVRIGAVNDALDLAHFTRDHGCEVVLCGPIDKCLRELAGGRSIRTLDGRSRSISKLGLPFYLASVIRWMVRLVGLRPDIVHLNYTGYAPSLALAAYLRGIPVVARAGPYNPQDRANNWIAAYAANCVPHAQSLLDSPLADKVEVVGDLFRPERLLTTATPERPLPPRINGRARFLFLGQLVERKGLTILVEALAGMKERADLLLVGGDWDSPGYPGVVRTLIDRLGLADRVFLENHRSDLAAMMANADVFVLPSLSEARPRSIIEAMLFGMPVVSTDVGGIPTLIESERTGLLVPPGDSAALARALDRLARSPDLRQQLGEAGRRRASADCQPERTAQRYLSLYRRLMNRYSGRKSSATKSAAAILDGSDSDIACPAESV